jgi:flavin reductase (DIM6/NTAB) family NADH-FMN oxidoreductase RutF
MAITVDEFKSLMRHWATGVTIVTTTAPDGPHGMTANSFTGVSLDPPLILICVDRRTRTHDHLQSAGAFGVHILHAGQEALSERCAGRLGEAGNQIGDLPHHPGPLGAPLLEECLAAIECRLTAAHDGGDHTIFVGEIHSVSSGKGEPLLYHDRAYRRVADRGQAG